MPIEGNELRAFGGSFDFVLNTSGDRRKASGPLAILRVS